MVRRVGHKDEKKRGKKHALRTSVLRREGGGDVGIRQGSNGLGRRTAHFRQAPSQPEETTLWPNSAGTREINRIKSASVDLPCTPHSALRIPRPNASETCRQTGKNPHVPASTKVSHVNIVSQQTAASPTRAPGSFSNRISRAVPPHQGIGHAPSPPDKRESPADYLQAQSIPSGRSAAQPQENGFYPKPRRSAPASGLEEERGTCGLRVGVHLHRAAPMPGRQAAAAVAAVVDDVLEAVHEEGDAAEADAEAETEGPGTVSRRWKVS